MIDIGDFSLKKKLFLTPCKTSRELRNWVNYFLGMEIPNCKVSRYADSTPAHMIWEIYKLAVLKQNPDQVKEILYCSSRNSGKCCIEGTLCLTDSGLKKIENIKEGDNVWSGKGWQNVPFWVDEGVKPGICVKTYGGPQITGTLHHRVLTINENNEIDWKELQDIKKGDMVYSNSPSIDINKESADFKDGWLVGIIAGDGCVSRQWTTVSITNADFHLLRNFSNLIYNKFGQKMKCKRNSRKSVTLFLASRAFMDWCEDILDGKLCYDKKLKTLEHSYDFLAGFVCGLIETDSDTYELQLANKNLVEQARDILLIFGVKCFFTEDRRKPRYSQFVKKEIRYFSIRYLSKLPEFVLPLYGPKREKFIVFFDKMAEQRKYPLRIIRTFGMYLKDKYKIDSYGWWKIDGKKVRNHVKYARELLQAKGDLYTHIAGYKIDSYIELATNLKEVEWVKKLNFIKRGNYYEVDSIKNEDYHFYDIEVENDHSYWSNGIISHNTLGLAIAEFLMMFHDQRECAHVGAILAQAQACKGYIQNFLMMPKVKELFIRATKGQSESENVQLPENSPILILQDNESRLVFNLDSKIIKMDILKEEEIYT